MTYSLTNKCAKNYYNRALIVQVIAENVVTCFFETQCSSVMRWMVVGVVVVDAGYTQTDGTNEHSTEQHGQRDRQTDRQVTKRFP